LRRERYANAVTFGALVRLAVEQRAVTTGLGGVAKAIALLGTVDRRRALAPNLGRAATKENDGRERSEGEP